MSTRTDGIDRMKAAAATRPLPTLAFALAAINAMPELDEAHRLTQAVLIDVICERSPAAEAAFDAWAQSDDADGRNGVAAIAEAALAAR